MIVTAAYQDGGDGSVTIKLFNTRQEGLDWLERTEEELEEGCPYDDGALEEIDVKVVRHNDGTYRLSEPVHLYFDQ